MACLFSEFPPRLQHPGPPVRPPACVLTAAVHAGAWPLLVPLQGHLWGGVLAPQCLSLLQPGQWVPPRAQTPGCCCRLPSPGTSGFLFIVPSVCSLIHARTSVAHSHGGAVARGRITGSPRGWSSAHRLWGSGQAASLSELSFLSETWLSLLPGLSRGWPGSRPEGPQCGPGLHMALFCCALVSLPQLSPLPSW